MYSNLSYMDEDTAELRRNMAQTLCSFCENVDKKVIAKVIGRLEITELQSVHNLTLNFFEELQQRFSNGFWLGILVGLSIGTALAALVQIFHKRLRYILL